MVDNERLEARKADNVVQESQIPLTCCCSSCSAVTQGQAAQLNIAGVQGICQTDAAIDIDDNKSIRPSANTSDGLRDIIIDGSNVAMSHGGRTTFSCRGIMLVVDWFRQRGHTKITVFVPQWRQETHKQKCPVTDPQILSELQQEKILSFTPSRTIRGKRVVCHDDRYIVRLAAETDGIIVSNDNYRDLAKENEGFRKAIEERLLMYTFVNDRFMPPDDPLGRHGPSLDDFLRKEPVTSEPRPPNCPYAKCTFGAKCRYYHPERASSNHRPSSLSGSGDKIGGSAVESRSLSGSSVAQFCKKKLSPRRRSYDKQSSENKHSHLKTFHSDPTDSSTCGHLELAKQLSNEYKGQGIAKCDEEKTFLQNDDKPERLHQQLRRQLAIQGNNDPRAAVKYSCQDTVSANLPTSDVSSCSVDIATHSDVDTSRVNHMKPEPTQPPLFNDTQQFAALRVSSQDRLSAAALLPSKSTCTDNVYVFRPVVFATDLQSYSRFSAPQLMPRFHMSPTWPQMLVYQSPAHLPTNEQIRHSAISTLRLSHR